MSNPKRDKRGRLLSGGSLNPKGRPPILLPEVQNVVNENRNALKLLVVEELAQLEQGHPKLRLAIRQCIDSAIVHGDAQKLKIILELGLGKVIEEAPEFEVSPEERLMIIEYRRRKGGANEPTT